MRAENPKRRPIKWTKEEDCILIKYYSEKGNRFCLKYMPDKTMQQIQSRCRKLGLHIDSIKSKEIFKNTKRETQKKRPNSDFNINIDQFLDIKTREVAYFLGFFWADGHVPSSVIKSGAYKSISFEINSEDFSDIKDVFESIGKWGIYKRKRKDTWKETTTITTCNQRLSEFLIQNDYHNKSEVSADKILSKIPFELKKYFFRGVSDGDGSFYHSKTKKGTLNQHSIRSTYNQDWNFMEKLYTEIGANFYISKSVTKKGFKSSCIRLNSNNVKLFGDYIYEDYDFDKIGLERKYIKYILIKKYVESNKTIAYRKSKELINSEKEHAIKLHNDGVLLHEILKITGISSGTFYRLMSKNRLLINNTKTLRAKNIEKAIILNKEGFSEKEISIKLKIGLKTIKIYLIS